MLDTAKQDMPAHIAKIAKNAADQHVNGGPGYGLAYGNVNAARLLFDALEVLFPWSDDKDAIKAMRAAMTDGDEHAWDELSALATQRRDSAEAA